MNTVKTCQCCGKVYRETPKGGVKNELGYFYNCECKTTLFWPSQETIEKTNRFKKAKIAVCFVLAMLSSQILKAESITLGMYGGTFASELDPDFRSGTELNFTYEKFGILYNVAALDIENSMTSLHFGVGYQYDFGDFFIGSMVGFLFKKVDHTIRHDENPYAEMIDFQNYTPVGYRLLVLPWITAQKDFKFSDDWSFSAQFYVNHLATHSSIGVKYHW